MLPAMVNKYVVKNLVKMKGEQQLCVYMLTKFHEFLQGIFFGT